MQGAFIATLGIVLSKILGIIYVIPFYAIIGDQGGALYGYAYSIYAIFLGISTAGVPLAISKIISEYNALGYYSLKERAFKLSIKTLNIIGIIAFIVYPARLRLPANWRHAAIPGINLSSVFAVRKVWRRS